MAEWGFDRRIVIGMQCFVAGGWSLCSVLGGMVFGSKRSRGGVYLALVGIVHWGVWLFFSDC
jgi:hypothetical protein